MAKGSIPREEMCPVAFALDIVGDKWTLLILRDLIFKGKHTYGDFLKAPEKISTNILANRLARMESEGLVTKERDGENLSRFMYRLTSKGKDLIPLLLEMIHWSATYNQQKAMPDSVVVGAPRNLLKRMEKNRKGVIREIVKSLS